MIVILYGDDITTSRFKLNELLDGAQWVTRLNGEKNSFAEIETAVDSKELFLDTKVVVIENIAKMGKNLERLATLLKPLEKEPQLLVYIWQSGTVPKKFLDQFKNAQVMQFLLPKYFFQFLDSCEPRQGKALHSLLLKLSAHFEAEQLFYMLVKRIRQLMILQSGSYNDFEETKDMSSWQIAKLTKQSKQWTEKQLLQFYQKLFALELGLKTSSLPTSLLNSIDILLLTEL